MITTDSATYTSPERRATPRHPFHQDARIVCADETLEALMKDIGVGGACVVLGESAPLSVGDLVQVCLTLPTLTNETSVTATVRWVGGPDRVMVGLQFTEGLRAREVWAIQQLGRLA